MIDENKKYVTRLGYEVKIIQIDVLSNKVHFAFFNGQQWYINHVNLNGRFTSHEHDLDLIEWSPYWNWKIDDKIIINAKYNSFKGFKRHFAGFDDGVPYYFNDGRTSFTSNGKWAFNENIETYERVE